MIFSNLSLKFELQTCSTLLLMALSFCRHDHKISNAPAPRIFAQESSYLIWESAPNRNTNFCIKRVKIAINITKPFDIESTDHINHHHCIHKMRNFCLIFCVVQINFDFVEASFRSRLRNFSRSGKGMNSIPARHKQDSNCMQPCQLEPNWIAFDKVMELSDIPISLQSFIQLKSDINHMINVGKCVGQCNAPIIPLYPHAVRYSNDLIHFV